MADSVATGFLKEVLRLTARDGNIAVLPEAARFALGKKAVLRMVVPVEALDEYVRSMDSVGVHSVDRALAVSFSSGTWSQISVVDEAECLPKACELVGLYLSLDHAAAAAASAADVHNSDEAGTLFGYPPCCVAQVEELAEAGASWPASLVRRSGEPSRWNAAANRVVADWGGIPPIGELFPCSLACEHAASIGRCGLFALKEAGLTRLAQRIKDDAVRGWILEAGRAVPSEALDCYRLPWQ